MAIEGGGDYRQRLVQRQLQIKKRKKAGLSNTRADAGPPSSSKTFSSPPAKPSFLSRVAVSAGEAFAKEDKDSLLYRTGLQKIPQFAFPKYNKSAEQMTQEEQREAELNLLEIIPGIGDIASIGRYTKGVSEDPTGFRPWAKLIGMGALSIANPLGGGGPMKREADDLLDEFSTFRDPLKDVEPVKLPSGETVDLEEMAVYADGVDNIHSFINDSSITPEDITSVPVGSLQQYLRSGSLPDAGDYLLDSPTSGLGELPKDAVVDVKIKGRTMAQNTQQVLAHFNSNRTRQMQADLAEMGVSYEKAKKQARASFDGVDISREIFNITDDMIIDEDTGLYKTLQYFDPNSEQWRGLGDHADHLITADYVGKKIKEAASKGTPSKQQKNISLGLYAWVNNKANFVGLYGSANMSRGAEPASIWQAGQPEEFVPTHREALSKAEKAFVDHMKEYDVSEKKARQLFAEAIGL